MSIRPPHNSARKRSAKDLPNRTPIHSPRAVISEDTMPMAARDTSVGRIDMTIETTDYCYVFEFKFEGEYSTALEMNS